MKTFKALHAILSFLEAALDAEIFPIESFTSEAFGLSKAHFCNTLEMLSDKGFIKGVSFTSVLGQTLPGATMTRPAITMDGLEYLHENAMMAKVAHARSGTGVFGTVG
jgi:hypothetical protein